MKNIDKQSHSRGEIRKNKKKRTPPVIHMLRWSFKLLGPLVPRLAAQKAMQLFMTPKRRKSASFAGVFKKAYLLGIPYKNSRISTYLWGETGKIVVLVHGWESSSRIYESFVVPLVDVGYRVVAVDGPAHGNSKLRQTNLFDFGDALHEVLKSLEKVGEVHALVGHSFGGSSLINMLYRKGKPASLKKVVTIASPSRLDNIFYYFFNHLRLPTAVRREFKILLREKFEVNLEDLKVSNWVPKLQIDNILVIHDAQDRVVAPQEADALVASGDNLTLMLTEGLGHNRIMKDPGVIRKILFYLHEKSAVTNDVESKLYQKAL